MRFLRGSIIINYFSTHDIKQYFDRFIIEISYNIVKLIQCLNLQELLRRE